MKTLRVLAAVPLAVFLWDAGCAESPTTPAGTDSNTNWLKLCREDNECGDLACLCGQCSRPCIANADCTGFSGASCRPNAAHPEACGTDRGGGACAVACGSDRDCASVGLTCVRGFCGASTIGKDAAPPPNDGRVDASTGSAGQMATGGSGGGLSRGGAGGTAGADAASGGVGGIATGGTNGSDSGSGGGGGATIATGGSTSTGSRTSSGGASSGGTTSSGGADAGPAPVVAMLTTDNLDIEPGAEAHVCQNFANPFGFDVAILESESVMSAGGVYVVVLNNDIFPPGAIQPCPPPVNERFIHDATELDGLMTYPPGVGRWFPALLPPDNANNIRINTHYLNSTSSVLHAQTTLRLEAVEASRVQHLASELYIMDPVVQVSSPSPMSQTRSATLPFGIRVIRSLGRTFSRGTHLKAVSGSEVLYDSISWMNQSARVLEPSVALAANSNLTITCDYSNSTGRTFSWGPDALYNEWCSFTAVFYPTNAADEKQKIFGF